MHRVGKNLMCKILNKLSRVARFFIKTYRHKKILQVKILIKATVCFYVNRSYDNNFAYRRVTSGFKMAQKA